MGRAHETGTIGPGERYSWVCVLVWTATIALMATSIVQARAVAAPSAALRPIQDEPPLAESRLALLKAGVLRHLPGHTEWPDGRFNDENNRLAPIIMTIVGEDGFGFESHVEQIVSGQRAHDRRIVVRRAQFPRPRPSEQVPDEEDLERFRSNLEESHIVYVGRSERIRGRYRQIIQWLDGKSVLTVSAIENFVEDGGMIRFTVRENRLAMDANIDAIRQSELRISSRWLRLARIVTSPKGHRGLDLGQWPIEVAHRALIQE